MTFHRSLSTGDMPRLRPPPADPDQPALSPTDEPHRRNVADAEQRPALFALGLLPCEPIHHADHEARRTFRTPSPPENPVAERSPVQRLPDRDGRPHPVFSSPLYRAFLEEAREVLARVRLGPNPGANARYIPELAHCDAERLQLSVATPSGALHSFGDATVFSLQSLGKMFILAAALQERGIGAVSRHLATSYSDLPFDGPGTAGLQTAPALRSRAAACRSPEATTALVGLVRAAGDTRFANASCNLGAIGMTLMLSGDGPGAAVGQQARLMRLAGALAPAGVERRRLVSTAHKIHGSEIRDTAGNQMRARVAAALMAGQLPADAHLPLPSFRRMQAYIAACSLAMDCSGLAATFAGFVEGRNVFTGQPLFSRVEARCLLAQMRVGGLYQDSAAFFLRTGMVAKSGVSGGIVAICPQTGLALAVHATHLDPQGNSCRGLALLYGIAGSAGFAALRKAFRQHRGSPSVPGLKPGP